MSTRRLIVIVIALAWPFLAYGTPLKTGKRYKVFFPKVELSAADGERIAWLQVRVYCGRVRAVSVIPDDWSLQVASPVSGNTSLMAQAGSDSTELSRLSDLDGAVVVSVQDTSCFDIAASVGLSTTWNGNRAREFGHSELLLKP